MYTHLIQKLIIEPNLNVRRKDNLNKKENNNDKINDENIKKKSDLESKDKLIILKKLFQVKGPLCKPPEKNLKKNNVSINKEKNDEKDNNIYENKIINKNDKIKILNQKRMREKEKSLKWKTEKKKRK